MRVLILNTDYEAFLEDLYAENPDWRTRATISRWRCETASLFGAADFYSEGLRANGVEAADIHLNNRAMQLRWAAEHGVNVHATDKPDRRALLRSCAGCSADKVEGSPRS